MGVKIDISFDNPSTTYHPEEVIAGNVFISTSDQLVVKGIYYFYLNKSLTKNFISKDKFPLFEFRA